MLIQYLRVILFLIKHRKSFGAMELSKENWSLIPEQTRIELQSTDVPSRPENADSEEKDTTSHWQRYGAGILFLYCLYFNFFIVCILFYYLYLFAFFFFFGE